MIAASTQTVDIMNRAVICGRINTKNQGAIIQTGELRKFARRHDRKITHNYIEHGTSGAKVRELRPEFNEMLKAAFRKEFDIIILVRGSF